MVKLGVKVGTLSGGLKKGGAEIYHNSENQRLTALAARSFLKVESNKSQLEARLNELVPMYAVGLSNVHITTVWNR